MAFERNRTLTLQRGLYLLEQRAGTSYAARAWIDGGWKYTNLETSDYQKAERQALLWFRRLKPTALSETMSTAMDSYLASIRDARKRTNHTWRWNAWREFFAPGMGRPDVRVDEIDSPKLLAFVEWRQSTTPNIKAQSLKKDLSTIRQCLKHAVMRGVIGIVPTFPGAHVLGRVVENPQPWLTKDEWSKLLKTAQERITDASNVRTRAQRTELLVFLHFMHATCMRVDEARHVRARDCVVKYTKAAPREVIERRAREAGKRYKKGAIVALDVQLRYLEIVVHVSKTGPRTTLSRVIAPMVVDWIAARKPGDLVFGEHHRDAFRELLIAANLRKTPYGLRNAKSLRPTAISHWLIAQPTIPLSWLAANVGTSITMLQQFYVKRLGLALDGLAWL